jgi:hypothetical protein
MGLSRKALLQGTVVFEITRKYWLRVRIDLPGFGNLAGFRE